MFDAFCKLSFDICFLTLGMFGECTSYYFMENYTLKANINISKNKSRTITTKIVPNALFLRNWYRFENIMC